MMGFCSTVILKVVVVPGEISNCELICSQKPAYLLDVLVNKNLLFGIFVLLLI